MKIFFKDLSFDLTREGALLRAKIKKFLEKNNHTLVDFEEEGDYIIVTTFGYFTDLENRVINYANYLFSNYTNSKKIIIYGQLIGTSKKIAALDFIFSKIGVKEEYKFEEIFLELVKFEEITSIDINHNELVYPDQDRIISINLTEEIITPCSYNFRKHLNRKSASKKFDSIIEEFKYIVNRGYYKILLTGDDVTGYGNDIGSDFAELFNKMCEIKGYYSIIIDYSNFETMLKIFPQIKDNFYKIKFIFMPTMSLCDKTLETFGVDYRLSDIQKLMSEMRESSDKTSIKNYIFYRVKGETFDDFKINLANINLFNMTYFGEYDNNIQDKDLGKKKQLVNMLRKKNIEFFRDEQDFVDSFE